MKLSKPSDYWFVAFVALPLLYLPDLQSEARLWRLRLLVVIIILAAVTSRSKLRQMLRQLPTSLVVLFGLMLGGMLITGLAALLSTNHIMYIGAEPEYLGWIAWLAMISAGVVLQLSLRQKLFGAPVRIVVVISLGLSLLYGLFYVGHGLALTGNLYQPTALAIYANLAVLLGLKHLNRNAVLSWTLAVLGIITVLVCQSRLGNIVLVVNLIMWSFYSLNTRRYLRNSFLVVTLLVILLPAIAPNSFTVLRAQSVPQGLSYETRLFAHQGKAVLINQPVYGHGPVSLPKSIDNQNYIPEDITKSLAVKTRFSANHNLFFDFGYYFGGLAGLALIILSGLAIRFYLLNRDGFSLEYLLLFTTLLANAFLEAPSLELTSWYFVILFGFFVGRSGVRKESPL